MVQGIPNGFYSLSNGGLAPSHLLNADALFMNGVFTPTPSYIGIGDRNISYFNDPGYGVPAGLHNEIIFNTALNYAYDNIARSSQIYAVPNVLGTGIFDQA